MPLDSMEYTSKVTPEDLADIRAGLESHYAKMHSRMRRADQLYQRDFEGLMELPEGLQIHESSTSSLIVDGLRDQIRVDEPQVSFTPRGKSQKASRHKDTMEEWGRNFLVTLPEHTLVNVPQQGAHDLLLRGAACWKIAVDVDALPEPPDRSDYKSNPLYLEALEEWRAARAVSWPFIVKAVDPLRLLPCPGNRQPLPYMIEVQDRRLYDVIVDYPDFKYPKTYSKSQRCNWVEYWDAETYMVLVDGSVLFAKKNPYGFVPYIYRYSGLGRANEDGDPAHLAVGILTSITGELEDEVRIKTAQTAQWLLHVFPRLITTDNPRVARAKFMKGPGSIVQVPDMNQAPKWMDAPPPQPAMLAYLAEIQQNIFKKAPAALSERPEGVDAAVHQALLIGQAVKIISPIKATLNNMGSELLNMVARLIVKFDLDTSVSATFDTREKMLSAADFSSPSFKVRFETTDPVENDRRMLAGLAILRQPGVMAKQTYREVFGKGVFKDNDTEEMRIMSEAIIEQMVASGVFTQAVLQEMQANTQEQALAQAQQDMRAQVEGAVPGVAERALETVAGGGTPIPGAEEAALGFGGAGVPTGGRLV